MEERDLEQVEHSVTILGRERLDVKGVSRVESFDEEEIVLETDLGMLTVRGQDLHIQNVDVERGDFCVEGLINGLQYSPLPRVRGTGKGKSKGFWDRILR